MPYLIKDHEGQFQGPYEDAEIEQWIAHGQMSNHAELKDFESGRISRADSIFRPTHAVVQMPDPTTTPVTPISRRAATYADGDGGKKSLKDVFTADDGSAEFIGTVIFSMIALFFAVAPLVRTTMGPPTYALGILTVGAIYAWRCGETGHSKSNLAWGIVAAVAMVALVVIGIRLRG